MRRATALVAALCALTAAASAQRGTRQRQTAPSQPATSAPRTYVAIGCISRQVQAQATRFLLTDRRSDPPQVYRLEGDESQFDLHTGHLVEVAGATSAAPAPARGAPARGAAASAGTLKVASLVWISNTCPKT
jgi:hypothetical protein